MHKTNFDLENMSSEELVKILNSMTREELEAEQAEREDLTEKQAEGDRFIKALNLRSGRTLVPFSFVYKMYLFFAKDNPIGKRILGQRLSKRFRKRCKKYQVFYYLKFPGKFSNFY